MNFTKTIFNIILFFVLKQTLAQNNYINLGGISNHILDRLEIKSGELNDAYYTSLKSYRRKNIANFVDSFNVGKVALSQQDYFNLQYLQNDNFEFTNAQGTKSKKPFLNKFYTKKAALFSVETKDFNLVVNPVLYYDLSTDKTNNVNGLINNRGIEIRGNITDKIGFYTQVSDEILQPYSWVYKNNEINGYFPNLGFYKSYPSYIGYFVASGYVTASLNKYIDLQFGHYKNFIGDGYRTFILGDQQPEYLNMRLNTRIWKLNYTNIWAELRENNLTNVNGRLGQQRKYTATHHLSVNIAKNFNIGIFETIIFHRDSGSNTTGFDLNYLNPVIFYKALENSLNSIDKSILGFNYKYNFLKHFSLYGQVVLSEFILKEILAGNGWWGNKFAIQTGLKYIDVLGIKNLDVQGEFNLARPYMYTSYNNLQTFTHIKQPMAHPLGANFYETIGIVRFQPKNRIFVTAKVIYAKYGNDINGSNFGKNIGLGYNAMFADTTFSAYGHYISQGVLTNLYYGELLVSYMPKHNLFVDFRFGLRKTTSQLAIYESNTSYLSLGVRLNIAQRFYDF